jgi:hypothetical protein
MDISASLAFIEERGSPLEKARWRHILYGVQPEPEVIQPFVALQNDDGGFPYAMLSGNLSTINNTLIALWWMAELGMLASPTADSAFGFLLAAQHDDGGWDEDPRSAQYDLPPWASPGQLHARLYLSAQSAYWLAQGSYKTHPAFPRALNFLLRHRDETGRFPGFLHTTWIATGVFAMAGQEYTAVVSQGFRVLMDRPLSQWEDSQIAWALDCLGSAGLPRSHAFIESALAELLHRRAPDGSWISEDGEARDVVATIQVLRVLKHFGLLR